MRRLVIVLVCGAALAVAGCASDDLSGPPQMSDDLMKGGQFKEPWLSRAVTEAQAHPLGSRENPVRVNMPPGERQYLGRLRCKDGTPPTFNRVGSFGAGAFASIIDGYDVRCVGSEPAETMIYMDMYFPDHVEGQAVNGFTLAPR